MANRTTVKSNIVTKNVPTVTNAILTDMLNAEMCDNLVFREDVAVTQVSSTSNITVDFTGKDRVDLTRTGGPLYITVAGINDGERKFLLITKTAGQAMSFAGSITGATGGETAYITDASKVLYEIVRKASYYYARAWLTTVTYATDDKAGIMQRGTVSEHNALSATDVICVPGRLPIASTTQRGLSELSTDAETQAGTSTTVVVTPASFYSAKVVDRGDPSAADFTSFTLDDNWHDLDLSAIVPAGAKAVFLKLFFHYSASLDTIRIRKNGNTYDKTGILCRLENTENYARTEGIVFIDSNRLLEYRFPATIIMMEITVAGWI